MKNQDQKRKGGRLAILQYKTIGGQFFILSRACQKDASLPEEKD
jgi:hypothetical protein